jgi:hypothetical protein
MDEWNISGDYRQLEKIFIEKLMEDFKSIPIPKGHICKSVSEFGIVNDILNTKL